MSLEGVLEIRTGPVRVSGYAIKLRRVINGVLRKYYLDKSLDPKKINESVSQLNSKLFEVIVGRYKVPKEAVVNIQLRFRVKDHSIVTEDINVEVFDKDEILSGNITSDVKELLTG